jgi:hypothetical protein
MVIAAAQCASPTSAPFRALQSNRRTTRRNHRAVHRAVFRHLSESGRDFQVNFSPAGPSRCRDPWICANFPATSSNFHRAAELRRRALRRGGHASWAVKRRGFGCEGTCTESAKSECVNPPSRGCRFSCSLAGAVESRGAKSESVTWVYLVGFRFRAHSTIA